jgi:nucleoside-diphosphate kinase|tara:strand:+ start:513 stop:935 length:423 start_codon:yes stop_codon:yes gene_type:complete
LNNKTLAIIKPDSVGKNNVGKILDRILSAGFSVVAMEQRQLSKSNAQEFYEIHRERPFFQDLVTFMTSGPCVPIVLEKNNAVAAFRKIIGSTNPEQADIGTIRKDFAENVQNNAIHGSDSDENARKEIAFFFPTLQIHNE